jgi:hypothetical protein
VKDMFKKNSICIIKFSKDLCRKYRNTDYARTFLASSINSKLKCGMGISK